MDPRRFIWHWDDLFAAFSGEESGDLSGEAIVFSIAWHNWLHMHHGSAEYKVITDVEIVHSIGGHSIDGHSIDGHSILDTRCPQDLVSTWFSMRA